MKIFILWGAIFFLPGTLVAQNPILSSEGGWQLQEMPILQPPAALIQQNYLYSSSCIGGSFPDQGYWIYCEARDQKEDSIELEGKKVNWLGLEGCEGDHVYYPSLNNQIPLAGLRNCQLLVAKLDQESKSDKQELIEDEESDLSWSPKQMVLLQLMDKEGNVLWSYDHSVFLEKLLPEGYTYPTVPYRDLIIQDQEGYLLFDGEYVVQVDGQGKPMWKTPVSEIIQKDINQSSNAQVTWERYRPRFLSTNKGVIYLTVPVLLEDTVYKGHMFIYQIDPPQQKFQQVFNSLVFEKNNESWNEQEVRSYEPLILGNGELAILLYDYNSLGLLKFNSVVKDWRIWWQEGRSNYHEILSIIQTPISQMILVHVSPIHNFADSYDDPEGIKGVAQDMMDYTIRLINIADDGKFQGENEFLLERDFTTTESTIQPIGYLAYMPLEGVRVMMNVEPDYWSDWQFFKLKQVPRPE